MSRLSPDMLKKRLWFDYRVCQQMFGPIFSGEAYHSTWDLERRKHPITSPDEGHLTKKYRIDFHMKTLIGSGQVTELTTIGFDLDVANYPYDEPVTWLISAHIPYSPHFKRGSPVCIGEIWQRGQGHMLLGQLFVHIARLLNWDETVRGGGYQGWNGEAIAYHKRVYHGRSITPGLQYPMLPTDLAYGIDTNLAPVFEGSGQRSLFIPLQFSTSVDRSLFKGRGHE